MNINTHPNQQTLAAFTQNPILAQIYENIVQVIQSTNSDSEKIELVTKLFAQLIDANLETSKTLVLQNNCIRLLKEKNQTLITNKKNLVDNNETLATINQELANRIYQLALSHGIIAQKNSKLKQDLQNMIDRTNELEDCLHVNENHLREQNRLKNAFDDLVKKNKEIQSKLVSLEVEKRIEPEASHLATKQLTIGNVRLTEFLELHYLCASPFFAMTFAGPLYLTHYFTKESYRKKLEQDWRQYANAHPEMSPKEAFEQILKFQQ